MGLLDSVLGAMGGGAGGGSLMGVFSGLLAGNAGSLNALVAQFQQAGLGDAAASWISTGANQPVSAHEVTQAVGPDMLRGFAQQLGLDPDQLAAQLSQLIPQVVDRLTPDGRLPAAGAPLQGDVSQLLGALLRR